MTTSNSPNLWRRRRSSKFTDTQPRLAMAVGTSQRAPKWSLGNCDDGCCPACGHHLCSCAKPEKVKVMEPEPAGASELGHFASREAAMLVALGCSVTELVGERLCVTAGSTTYSVDATSQAVRLVEMLTAERAVT